KLDNNLIFHDRVDAGCQLAAHPYLQKIKSLPLNEKNSYLVISLPRGGTVVGDEVAKQLKITHDLVFSRKIPCPRQPEFAIGAVSELGDVIWNDYAKQEKLIDKPHVQQNATMKSAILTCKYLNVKSIIVAVPCSATDCIEDISKSVDKVICLTTPDD
ncbi:unnamed protein product, partial [Rotaria sp. Silwood1]